MDEDKGDRKTREVDEAPQQGAAAREPRAPDDNADSTDPAMLGGGARGGAEDDVAGTAARGDGVLTLDLDTSPTLLSGDAAAARDHEGDLPRGAGLTSQEDELAAANPQGDDLAVAVYNYKPPALAVLPTSPTPVAVWPRQSSPPPQPPPAGWTSAVDVDDLVDRFLPLGYQQRAAASAITAAVSASANPARAAATIAAAGWLVSVPPSRNLPVPPQEQCSSCGLRKGITADRPRPHRCLCVECILDNAVCPVCGPAGHQAGGA